MSDYIPVMMAVFLLIVYSMLGLRMRRYGSPAGRAKTAACTSGCGLLVVLMAASTSGLWNTGFMAIGLVCGPWLSFLIGRRPAFKRLGTPRASDGFRFAQEATVVIEIGQVQGSGFFISDDKIVTALHILAADIGGRIWAHTSRGQLELELLALDPSSDLLVLKTKSPAADGSPRRGVMRLAASTEAIPVGSRLTYAGYIGVHLRVPQWRELTGKLLFQGRFAAYDNAQKASENALTGDDPNILVSDLPLSSGTSGGAILNEENEVVGVVDAGRPTGECLAIHVEHLHDLLANIS